MRNPNSDGSLTEYLWPTVPKLFSETLAVLESSRMKIRKGGDLHTDEISRIRDTFHEESLDAQSLKCLVGTKVSMFLGDYSEKAEMAETVIADIRKAVDETSAKVVETLKETSWSSTFFASSLSYLELCESRAWREDDPGIVEEVLFRFIGEDFEAARSKAEAVKTSAGEAISPIQGEIAYVANTGNDPERLSKLALERALLAGKLRDEAEPVFETIRSDFEKLRKRAAKHGYKLSFAWD